MLDFRPILFIVGTLLTTLAMAMCLPAATDLVVGHKDWRTFAISALVTLFVGVSLMLTNRVAQFRLNLRQAFVVTSLSWLMLTVFAALPFAFAELDLSYTDAFFEAMSGVTTTGSTVITNLAAAPPGILLWRALLQWMGGIGIIVMAMAILPVLQVGGMQLFRLESSDKSDKALPRATQLAAAIGVVYLVMTLACTWLYWAFGMTGFEAIAHAMTTIATGGYSTADASIGHFNSGPIDATATVFMLLGSLPFVLYLQFVRGDLLALLRNSQVQWFLTVVLLAILAMFLWLWLRNGLPPGISLRYASFNVVSVITGTGYATADYWLWGTFAVTMFFLLMFTGGCAGSTTCGIKIFRYQVLYQTARAQMGRLLQPHGVFIPYYNGRPISEQVQVSVMSFFFVYVLCFALLAMGLGLTGLDFLTCVSGAATAIANVGPGLGEQIGPAGNFSQLPDAAKWLLSVGMLIGRLELFTVLVLLIPSFWTD
ncbi:MAG: TrkH family potassium uptake protein [Alphaproteobacteria bacterium]